MRRTTSAIQHKARNNCHSGCIKHNLNGPGSCTWNGSEIAAARRSARPPEVVSAGAAAAIVTDATYLGTAAREPAVESQSDGGTEEEIADKEKPGVPKEAVKTRKVKEKTRKAAEKASGKARKAMEKANGKVKNSGAKEEPGKKEAGGKAKMAKAKENPSTS